MVAAVRISLHRLNEYSLSRVHSNGVLSFFLFLLYVRHCAKKLAFPPLVEYAFCKNLLDLKNDVIPAAHWSASYTPE